MGDMPGPESQIVESGKGSGDGASLCSSGMRSCEVCGEQCLMRIRVYGSQILCHCSVIAVYGFDFFVAVVSVFVFFAWRGIPSCAPNVYQSGSASMTRASGLVKTRT